MACRGPRQPNRNRTAKRRRNGGQKARSRTNGWVDWTIEQPDSCFWVSGSRSVFLPLMRNSERLGGTSPASTALPFLASSADLAPPGLDRNSAHSGEQFPTRASAGSSAAVSLAQLCHPSWVVGSEHRDQAGVCGPQSVGLRSSCWRSRSCMTYASPLRSGVRYRSTLRSP